MAKLATEIEGHPDNVLPAIFGGMILAFMTVKISIIQEYPLIIIYILCYIP